MAHDRDPTRPNGFRKLQAVEVPNSLGAVSDVPTLTPPPSRGSAPNGTILLPLKSSCQKSTYRRCGKRCLFFLCALDLGHGEFTARSMKRLDKARLHVRDEIQGLALRGSVLEDLGVLALYDDERL